MTDDSPNSQSVLEPVACDHGMVRFSLRDLFAFTTLVSILLGYAVQNPDLWTTFFELLLVAFLIEALGRLSGRRFRHHVTLVTFRTKTFFWLVIAVLVSGHHAVMHGIDLYQCDQYGDRISSERIILSAYRGAITDPQVVKHFVVIAAIGIVIVIARWSWGWKVRRQKQSNPSAEAHGA